MIEFLEALAEFKITVYGGFAIVTLLMWGFWFVVGLITIYQSRLFRPTRKFIGSVLILIKPSKQYHQYVSLHRAGYIYKWSLNLCLLKNGKGVKK